MDIKIMAVILPLILISPAVTSMRVTEAQYSTCALNDGDGIKCWVSDSTPSLYDGGLWSI